MQHGTKTVYDHTLSVAHKCLELNEKYNLCCDEEKLVRGALLHDYFLYDWHTPEKWHRLHGFKHPFFALENAKREYEIDCILEDMIKKHMFPLIPIPPMYKESWVLCLADKICATKETIKRK